MENTQEGEESSIDAAFKGDKATTEQLIQLAKLVEGESIIWMKKIINSKHNANYMKSAWRWVVQEMNQTGQWPCRVVRKGTSPRYHVLHGKDALTTKLFL